MKKIAWAAAGLIALSTAPALAADLAARPYTKAPPPVVAPIYNWAGFYIGLNGGGGSAHKCWDLNGLGGVFFPAIAEGCHDATGGVFGGQIGYRWQAANWVFGLEAQGDWANLKGSNTSLLVPPALAALGISYTNNTKVDAFGLFTGQVGYAWNNVLWYVKGGAAVTHDKYFGVSSPALGLFTFDNASEDRWGGTVGTGLEIGFAPGWSVAFEYDHLFMGTRNVTTTLTGPAAALLGPAAFRNERIREDVDIGTIRVNYTFGGPVVAKY
jgi:outer membrane immunogenic protein